MSAEQGSAERGAGARLRDATVQPIVGASPAADPMRVSGVRSQRVPLPPCDAPLWGCDGHDYFGAADNDAPNLTDNCSEAAI